mgnify:CR=1 FL=1
MKIVYISAKYCGGDVQKNVSSEIRYCLRRYYGFNLFLCRKYISDM